MASAIDANFPMFGNPTTESVRQNFAAARDEITDLLDRLGEVETGYLPLAGGTLTGPLMLADDPALPLGAASRRFVESVASLRAPLASPAFTGTPTAPTPAAGDDSNRLATTAFVKALGGGISGVTAGTGLAGGGASGAVTLTLATPVAVAHGGLGLSGGTAGGLLYFNTASTLASSPAYGVTLLMTGGGPNNPPGAAASWSIPTAGELRGSTTGAALGTSGVNPTLRLAAQDNGFPGLVFEAWGTGGGFIIGRTAGGTGTAPVATPINANLLTISGRGYDTAYSTADAARIRFYTAEAFSAAGRGAGIDFFTTPGGTTTLVNSMRLAHNGALVLPQSIGAAPGGAGTINVSGGYYVNSTILLTPPNPGTSGGVPYYSAGGTLASSAALASRGLVLGGGAGAAPLTSGAWTSPANNNLVGNLSGAAAPAILGPGLQIVGAAASQAAAQVDSFAASSQLVLRRGNGVPGAPAAIAGAERLAVIWGGGHDGSAYQNPAAITFEARQAFSATARGTGLQFWGTPVGATAITALMTLGTGSASPSGGMAVPNNVAGGDLGTGTINVSAGYYLGGQPALTISGTTRTLSLNGGATINLNTGPAPPMQVTGLQIIGADNQNPIAGLQMNGFGAPANTQLRFMAALGTAAAPLPVAQNTILGDIFSLGWNGAGAYTRGVILRLKALENWTATANGAGLDIIVTPPGTTNTQVVHVHGAGSLLVPNTVTGGNMGAGTINVSTGYFVNGVPIGNVGAYLPLAGGTLTGALTAPSVTFSGIGTPNAQPIAIGFAGDPPAFPVAVGGVHQGFFVTSFETAGIRWPASAIFVHAGFEAMSAWTTTSGYGVAWSTNALPTGIVLAAQTRAAGDALAVVARLAVRGGDYQPPDDRARQQHWPFVLLPEEVEVALPYAVLRAPRRADSAGEDEAAVGIHPHHLIAVLWRAVQQLAGRLDALEPEGHA